VVIVDKHGRALNGAPTLALTEEQERRGAIALLEHLKHLKPSGAAPLTTEDMEIFQHQAMKHGIGFSHFARAAYLDYFTFYMRECSKAANAAMRVLS